MRLAVCSLDKLSGVVVTLGLGLMVACGGGDSGGDAKSATTLSDGQVDACASIGWKVANGRACQLPDDPSSSSLVRLRIQMSNGNNFAWCTGTVIDPHVVLTAGHCISNGATQVDIDTTAGTVTASQAILHPGYTSAYTDSGEVLFNDMALLITDQPLEVVPASLLASRSLENGEPAIVAGFGITEPGGLAGTMNAGNASVRDITANHVFVQYADNESHPCPGDSGGPLLVMQNGRWLVAGVVSQSDPSVSGDAMCRPGDITLYTNAQNTGAMSFIQTYAPNVGLQ